MRLDTGFPRRSHNKSPRRQKLQKGARKAEGINLRKFIPLIKSSAQITEEDDIKYLKYTTELDLEPQERGIRPKKWGHYRLAEGHDTEDLVQEREFQEYVFEREGSTLNTGHNLCNKRARRNAQGKDHSKQEGRTSQEGCANKPSGGELKTPSKTNPGKSKFPRGTKKEEQRVSVTKIRKSAKRPGPSSNLIRNPPSLTSTGPASRGTSGTTHRVR